MMCEFDGWISFNWATSAARLSNVGGGAAARPCCCCAATAGKIAPGYPARSTAMPKRTPHATSNTLRNGILVVIPSPPVGKRTKRPREMAECNDSGRHHQQGGLRQI